MPLLWIGVPLLLSSAAARFGALLADTSISSLWQVRCCRPPALKRIYAEFGRRDDFLLIGISGDFDKGSLRKFLRSKEISWHQVFETEGGGAKLSQALGVQAIPFTLLLGPDGKVISAGLSGERLHAEIAKRLKPE